MRVFFSLPLLVIIPSAFAQIPVQIDSIFNFIKRNSIHTNNVNWTSIEKDFNEKLKSAKSDVDSIKTFSYVFESLNDYHSSITYKGNTFSNYPQFNDSIRNRLLTLMRLSQTQQGNFVAKIIETNYLYLQVPSVNAWGNDVSVFAQKLSDTLCNYFKNNTRGIILDLRLNGGGQFSSMAAGIAPLYDSKYIGGGIDNSSKISTKFFIKDGNLFMNTIQSTTIKHKTKLNLSKISLVVLIGPITMSSGSILGITLKGRKNTIFIGENTADGYTTCNNYFTFGEQLALNLAIEHSVDRNNTIYKQFLMPDRIINGGDNFDKLETDKKIVEGLKWLKSLNKK